MMEMYKGAGNNKYTKANKRARFHQKDSLSKHHHPQGTAQVLHSIVISYNLHSSHSLFTRLIK